jgi:novobiocin biosynthesis protein NovU/D-mycarose 3-C-methyltransferase
MKRTSCSACGSPDLDQFLDLGMSPVADAYTATADEESPTYPLQVAVCAKCRLVQLLEVLDGETLFGTGYSFYSSASAPLSAYHAEYANDVAARYWPQARRGLVEIGCNDGDMLRHFRHLRHLGIDPAAGPIDAAMKRGCNVIEEPFGLDTALDLRERYGPWGVVIANHVLAHVEDVAGFLAGIAHLMDDESIAMVEVQYLPDLLVNNAFDLIYHEHRNFFSLRSLGTAAIRHGLHLVDAKLTDRQGGSLRATFRKRGSLTEATSRVGDLLDSETWLNEYGAYEGMQGRAERIRTRLRDLIGSVAGPVAVHGAPAKATTLLNFCELTAAELPWCVDTTRAKQGRYIPGTGIPILPTHPQPPKAQLLAAWNYAPSITRKVPYWTQDHHWILPLPAPMLL